MVRYYITRRTEICLIILSIRLKQVLSVLLSSVFNSCTQEEDADSDVSIVWSEDDFEDDDGIVLNSEEDQESLSADDDDVHDDIEGQDALINSLLCRLIFMWQVLHGLSERVMEGLLCIISGILINIAESYPVLADISQAFPSSLYRFRKLIGINRDHFQKFIMCPKCAKLYSYDEINGPTRIVKCTNSWLVRALPNRELKRCSTNLVKEVHTADNKLRIHPLKTFCYNNIISVLQSMIKRPHFLKKCNDWQNRISPSGIMTDVYDGLIWQSFFGKEGRYSGENNFGFLLNVDWFQPYKRRSTSIGAIYLTCLNLPREERYKRENIIVVGIIPSMGDGGEPPSLNTLIKPLVDDFKRLFAGVEFEISNGKVMCYGYLIGCSSDIPANKKLCGFLSHSAHKGCSRCLKEFKSMRIANNHSKLNYSGFNERQWNMCKRTDKDHREKAKRISKATDKKHQETLEKEYGMRDSRLLELPYYDAIRFCLIDPMHNLFLGTSKKIFNLWLELGLLNSNSLKTIKEMIQNVKLPADVGRIPSNIESNHSRFTAEEWKNWTLYYSPFVLRNVLPDKDYKCWQKFVLACTFLCSPHVTEYEINLANSFFFAFGSKVEELYGAKVITPNMHFHGHLAECVRDYGPVQAFWCFAFERFNGVISDIPTNHHSIEIQYMRSILNWASAGTDLPHDDKIFDALLRSLRKPTVFYSAISLSSSWQGSITVDTIQNLSTVKLSGKAEYHGLTEDDLGSLRQMYTFFYQDISEVYLTKCCSRYRSIMIGQERFGSIIDKRSSKSSFIVAVWCGPDGKILNADEAIASKFRPGKVKYFFKHPIKINDQYHDHIIAYVTWYGDHNETDLTSNLKPISVWKSEKYVPAGPANFIPVQRISGKCTMLTDTLRKLVYVCPLQRKI